MSNLSEQLAEIQKKLLVSMRPILEMSAGMDFSHSAKALLESMRPALAMTANMDLSHTTKALLETMRPALAMTVGLNASHTTRTLIEAMRPFVNKQLLTAQTNSMNAIASAMVRAIPPSLFTESTRFSVLAIQRAFADTLKDFDTSYIRDSLSRLSFVLNDFRGILGDELTDVDEEQQVEFEADVKSIVDGSSTQNWQQRFSGNVRKWGAKNPVLAFILMFFVFQMMIMIMYDTAKYLLIKPQQATVRELPSITAEVVVKIEQYEMVTVVDSQNHWVKVVYLNPEDGDVYEGWLSKRSCMEIEFEEQEESEDAVDIEDTENEEVADDEQEEITE